MYGKTTAVEEQIKWIFKLEYYGSYAIIEGLFFKELFFATKDLAKAYVSQVKDRHNKPNRQWIDLHERTISPDDTDRGWQISQVKQVIAIEQVEYEEKHVEYQPSINPMTGGTMTTKRDRKVISTITDDNATAFA